MKEEKYNPEATPHLEGVTFNFADYLAPPLIEQDTFSSRIIQTHNESYAFEPIIDRLNESSNYTLREKYLPSIDDFHEIHENRYSIIKKEYKDIYSNSEGKYTGTSIERYIENNDKNQIIGRKIAQIALQNIISNSSTSSQFTDPQLGLLRSMNGNSRGYMDLQATQPEDLPKMALRVLEFVDEVQPHIIIGCDRGGRLFGLAMHAAWRRTRDGMPFPTLDGKIHFARISKAEDPAIVQQKVDAIVKSCIAQGTQRGNELKPEERLRVLFVDDWIIGGGTKRFAYSLMEKYDADSYFAVMCGNGADSTGDPVLKTSVSWHDHPDEIGINYLSSFTQNSDGTITQAQKAMPVRTLQAKDNRDKIQEAAAKLPALQRA